MGRVTMSPDRWAARRIRDWQVGCPVMAQSGHPKRVHECPLSGV